MAVDSHSKNQEPLLIFIADYHLPYLVPAILYWILGFAFDQIDRRELLSKYKIHTLAESTKRDRASKRDVITFALIQQVAQCILGYWTASDTEIFSSDHYHVELWAQKLHAMRSSLKPSIGSRISLQWDWHAANAVYFVATPIFQFMLAMILADTFQYFTHRGFHVNKWLYKHIHYMHHDVYVPFAYGALYNHPLETIPIDCVGLPTCLYLAGLSNRQSALFGAIWTFKTVVDHCGYVFPWNPCNIICSDSVRFHDLHHQAWGMKHNFSVYTSFWDRFFGTYWDGSDSKAKEKYQRGRELAYIAVKKHMAGSQNPATLAFSTAVEVAS